LGYNIDAINGSEKDVSSSIDIDTIKLNLHSVVSQFNRPAADGRGFGQRLDSDEASGRFAGAEMAIQGSENVR
jgi:hypothetical protein